MPVTIRDVAVLVGVSPPTVGRTCKDHPSISRQTKEKVRQTMAKLGYELNFQTNSLAAQNSRTIGITLSLSERETYRNASYLEVICGVNQYCNQRQYINTVIIGQNEEEILQMIKNMIRTGLTEGLIVLYSREQGPAPDYLHEEGILYVLVGKTYRNVDRTVYMDNDNVSTGKETAEYLLELGHERIAYLFDDHPPLSNNDRGMGYMLALTERGIGFLPGLCVEVPSVPEKQNEMLYALLAHTGRPTVILISGDIPAMTLEKECTELGFPIPGDMSIISSNNSLPARLTVPSLASVDVNSCQLGIQTVAQMTEHVEDPELVATKVIVPHRLVERGSCTIYKRL